MELAGGELGRLRAQRRARLLLGILVPVGGLLSGRVPGDHVPRVRVSGGRTPAGLPGGGSALDAQPQHRAERAEVGAGPAAGPSAVQVVEGLLQMPVQAGGHTAVSFSARGPPVRVARRAFHAGFRARAAGCSAAERPSSGPSAHRFQGRPPAFPKGGA